MKGGIEAELLGGTFVPMPWAESPAHLVRSLQPPELPGNLGWRFCLITHVTVGFSAGSIYTPLHWLERVCWTVLLFPPLLLFLLSPPLLPELHLGRSPSLLLRFAIPLGILLRRARSTHLPNGFEFGVVSIGKLVTLDLLLGGSL